MRFCSLSVLSVIAAALLIGPATPLPSSLGDMVVKHRWDAIPNNWVTQGHPHNRTTIDLYIALKPQREEALIDALYEVSEPSHPKYGLHLTKEEVAELVAPRPETLELVSSWLRYHGVPLSSISTTHGGCWLTVVGVPVSQANELLGASYQLFYHAETNNTILRTVGYALPAVLHGHVDTVAPTTSFAPSRLRQQTPQSQSFGAAEAATNVVSGKSVKALSRRDGRPFVGPQNLRWLYNTIKYVPKATDKNSLGIVGFQNDYPSPEDLKAFMLLFRADALYANYTVTKVNGGEYDPKSPGMEASIDTQYAGAIAFPTPQIFYSVGGGVRIDEDGEPDSGDGYLEWLEYMTKHTKVPQTISLSYGNRESTITKEYAVALCKLFGQLGARGASVLAASGDLGVGHGDCKDASGKVQFDVVFPASCPWVTGVGGTIDSQDSDFLPEVAFSLSGGGFSAHFPRAWYQSKAVPPFLEHLGDDYAGFYNARGRGVPDISAYSSKYALYVKGETYVVSGTSCATPTAAGIISLLNDYLLSEDKPTLGFLNPWLYSRGFPGLRDVESGRNQGCGTKGFAAIEGWDAVTGIGTPDFKMLQDQVNLHWPMNQSFFDKP